MDSTKNLPPRDDLLCGLVNHGNSCYFNSAFQALANQTDFLTALQSKSIFLKRVCASTLDPFLKTKKKRLLLACQILILVEKMTVSLSAVPTAFFLNTLRDLNSEFESLQQADAAEVLFTLLTSIEDELHQKIDLNNKLFTISHKENVNSTWVQNGAFRKKENVSDNALKWQKERKFYYTLLCLENYRQKKKTVIEQEKNYSRLKNSISSPMNPNESSMRGKNIIKTNPSSMDNSRITFHQSVISDYFQGFHLTTLTCSSCKKEKYTTEPFLTLDLNIPSQNQIRVLRQFERAPEKTEIKKRSSVLSMTFFLYRFAFFLWTLPRLIVRKVFGPREVDSEVPLLDCFKSHCNQETLRGENAIMCETCGGQTESFRKSSFLFLPRILILHLKRFQYGLWNGTKVRTPVPLPEAIRLHHFVQHIAPHTPPVATPHGERTETTPPPEPASSLPLVSYPERDFEYHLDAVINHHGDLSCGHYTTYAHKSTLGWILCNDENLLRVSKEEVLQSEVYVAIYRRTCK